MCRSISMIRRGHPQAVSQQFENSGVQLENSRPWFKRRYVVFACCLALGVFLTLSMSIRRLEARHQLSTSALSDATVKPQARVRPTSNGPSQVANTSTREAASAAPKDETSVAHNHSSASSAAGARVMIFSIDDRPLSSDLNKAAYPSLSAVVNHRIAQKMGADYAYLSAWIDPAQVERLESTVGRRWRGNFSEKVPYDRSKRMYHPTLGLPRPLAWATVLVAWHLATTQAHKYDYILYLDTDAILLDDAVPVPQLVRRGYKKQSWGSEAADAGLVFFDNNPYGKALPCAGVFVAAVRKGAADMLRQWWDNEFLGGSFDFPPMQLGLWAGMGLKQRIYKLYTFYKDKVHMDRFFSYDWRPRPDSLLNASSISVLDEQPFAREPYSPDDGTPRWIRHVHHSVGKGSNSSASVERARLFWAKLQELGVADPAAFAAEIEHIRLHHMAAPIDVQAVAYRMAEASKMDSLKDNERNS